jgi:hypothetical protein
MSIPAAKICSMPKFSIYFGNIREFKQSFYDTICLGCNEDILRGDPCGYIRDPKDTTRPANWTPSGDEMFCRTCLYNNGKPAEIHVSR